MCTGYKCPWKMLPFSVTGLECSRVPKATGSDAGVVVFRGFNSKDSVVTVELTINLSATSLILVFELFLFASFLFFHQKWYLG